MADAVLVPILLHIKSELSDLYEAIGGGALSVNFRGGSTGSLVSVDSNSDACFIEITDGTFSNGLISGSITNVPETLIVNKGSTIGYSKTFEPLSPMASSLIANANIAFESSGIRFTISGASDQIEHLQGNITFLKLI